MITKSPPTGIYEESDCSGEWGEEFEKCGIGGTISKGKYEKAVHLILKDNKIDIKDASHLWSKDSFEVGMNLVYLLKKN